MKQTIFVLILFLFATLITPTVNSSVPQVISEFNELVLEHNNLTTTPNSPVYTVDHFSNFDAIADNADGVHPNRNGDIKMAEAWINSLLSINLNLSKNYSIMPLGDSITHLNYRYDLWLNLKEANIIFDFVGNENHLPWGADESNLEFDSDHEGHGGWRSDQISYNIESWVKLNTPDIVLFHVGTNDLAQGYDPSHVIEHIGKTIDILRLYNPEIIIFVAQIIPFDLEIPSDESKGFGLVEYSLSFIGLLIIAEILRKNHFKKI
ncbi:MAG: hypothetical protein CMB64_02570 [Euryarchaeota archaeon]|nr:hypothetical protein [Euryarchaeota archaeon]